MPHHPVTNYLMNGHQSSSIFVIISHARVYDSLQLITANKLVSYLTNTHIIIIINQTYNVMQP